MASGLLSLKWNNHRSTFFHVLSSIRSKESYCDATLACDGRFYPVHKLVLSTCSEYFEQIFERTQCKHPVIVLKDIRHDDLEALMNYMYVGEVNVLQERLAGLIKAAECLKIKGLAVPDEDPFSYKEKRNQSRGDLDSPHAKRRRRDEPVSYDDRDGRDRPITSRNSRLAQREQQITHVENLPPENNTVVDPPGVVDPLSEAQNQDLENQAEHPDGDHSGRDLKPRGSGSSSSTSRSSSHKPVPGVSLDESSVKTEPPDIQDEEVDTKETLHSNLGFDPSGDGDSLSAGPASVASGSNEGAFSDSNAIESTPQSVEDVVAQALPPTSSSFQGGNSFPLWEGDGNMQNFPGEGYSGENSQGRPMVKPQTPECATQWGSSFPGLHLPERSALENPSVGSSSPLLFSDETLHLAGRKCPVCHRNFPSPSHMKRHLRTHTGEKPFHCALCPYQTADKGNLDKHQKQHTGERPFPCGLCPYRATQKIHLLSHLRVHSKERPYGCDICFKRFSDKQSLKYHSATIHSTTIHSTSAVD